MWTDTEKMKAKQQAPLWKLRNSEMPMKVFSYHCGKIYCNFLIFSDCDYGTLVNYDYHIFKYKTYILSIFMCIDKWTLCVFNLSIIYR